MQLTRTDLLLLAFLSEKPCHVWEIDRSLVSIGAHLWVEYSRPHLYYALRKLKKEGLVALVAADEKKSKKEYGITAKGKGALKDKEVLSLLLYNPTRFDFDLILGMADRFKGGNMKLAEVLEQRQEALQNELSEIQEVWQKAEQQGGMTFGRAAVIKHRIKFLKSELEFLKWLDKNTPEDWKSLDQLETE
jgi:DNA-binding PadR family transcriptional regulator